MARHLWTDETIHLVHMPTLTMGVPHGIQRPSPSLHRPQRNDGVRAAQIGRFIPFLREVTAAAAVLAKGKDIDDKPDDPPRRE